MIFCIQVKEPVGDAIGKKDDQRYGWRIKQETFVNIALYQRDNRTLKAASGTIDPGEIFKRAGK